MSLVRDDARTRRPHAGRRARTTRACRGHARIAARSLCAAPLLPRAARAQRAARHGAVPGRRLDAARPRRASARPRRLAARERAGVRGVLHGPRGCAASRVRRVGHDRSRRCDRLGVERRAGQRPACGASARRGLVAGRARGARRGRRGHPRVAAAARRAQALRPGLGLRRGHRPGGALRGRVRAALLVRRRSVRAVARERLRSEADRRCARRGARPSVDRARVRVASGRRDGRALAGAARLPDIAVARDARRRERDGRARSHRGALRGLRHPAARVSLRWT